MPTLRMCGMILLWRSVGRATWSMPIRSNMLCRECDVITPAHDSGLCPACRGEENAADERRAWLEFEAGWLERNLCVKRA